MSDDLHALETRLAAAQAEGLAANFERWLKFAGHVRGVPYELQALKVRVGRSGYVESRSVFAATAEDGIARLLEAEKFDCPGVYAIANRLHSSVATRAEANVWRSVGKGDGTSDNDIASRVVLYVDCDARRRRGISASDVEMAHAVSVALGVYETIAAILEGDAPLGYGHSGNGRAVLIRCDELDESAAAPFVSGIVRALSLRFNTTDAEIDTSVVDAKRLLPAWGSIKRKGARNNTERPHRRTAFISSADVRPVRLDELETLFVALREDLDEAGRAEVDKVVRAHCSGVRGASGENRALNAVVNDQAQTRRATTASAGEEGIFRRANDVPIESVLDRLGLDRGSLTCPGCGAVDGVEVFKNGLKCHHKSCAGRGRNGYRTVVDLVSEMHVSTPYDAARLISEWHNGDRAAPSPTSEIAENRTEVAAAAQVAGDSRVMAPTLAAPLPTLTSSSDSWPAPMAEAAFHGLLGDVVRAIEPHTEADRVALLSQALCFFGNAIGSGPHLIIDAARHTAKLFVALVGKTSKGRKGTALARVESVFSIADKGWVEDCCTTADLSSGEGLVHALRDRRVGVDRNGQEQVVDEGVTDKRLLVLQSEFSSVCAVIARQGNTLSATVRQAWDKGNLGTLTKNSAEEATGTHVSIVGHITVDELRRTLSQTEIANGFGNRFIWVCVARSKLLPFGGGDVDLAPLARRLAAALRFARGVGQVHLDEQAKELWRAVYPELSEAQPGLAGSMTARSEAQTLRLALTYALLDESSLIGRVHLEAALAFWAYAAASAKAIWGDRTGDDMADEILRFLRASPAGQTQTAIRDHFSRSKPVGPPLAMLIERGLVRVERRPTGGRPEARYFIVSPPAASRNQHQQAGEQDNV